MGRRFGIALLSVCALGAWGGRPAYAVIEVYGDAANVGWEAATGPVAGYDVFASFNGQSETLVGTADADALVLRVQASLGDTVVVRVQPHDASGNLGPMSELSDEIRFLGGANDDSESGHHHTRMDFNGDSHGDILIQNFDSRDLEVWMMNGPRILESSRDLPEDLDESWRVAATGDLNGDGMADLVWRRDTGSIALWLNDNGHLLDSAEFPNIPAEWDVVSTADLDGDGNDDVLYYRASDNMYSAWLMDGVRIKQKGLIGNPALQWTLQASPDLNGDGNEDLLWRHESGILYVWMMDGLRVLTSTTVPAPGPEWHLVGTPDLDGDQAQELLWRHDAGLLYAWFMNGTTIAKHGGLQDPGPEWHIVGIRDFDGDGRDDFLWQHEVGLLYQWFMDGRILQAHAGVGSPGAGFEVVE